MVGFGEEITIRLTWPQILRLWLDSLYWFVAGWLCAIHDWQGVLYALALRVLVTPLGLVLRGLNNMSKEVRRG